MAAVYVDDHDNADWIKHARRGLTAGAVLLEFEYDESKHPRTPAGEPGGGRWTTGAEGSPTFADHVSVLHTTSAAQAADILAHGFNPLYGTRVGSKFGEGIYASFPTHSGIDVQTRLAVPNSVQLELEVGTNKALRVDPGWEIESDAWERKMYEEAGVTKEQMVSRGSEIVEQGMANWREYGGGGDVEHATKEQIDGFSDWLLESKGEMAATPFVDGKSQALREAVVKQGYDSIVYHDPTGATGMGDMIVAMHANQIEITGHHDVGPAPKVVQHLDPVTLLPLPKDAAPVTRTGNESDGELLQRGYTPHQISEMRAEKAKYAVAAAASRPAQLMSLVDFLHLFDRPLQAAGVLEFDFDEAKHPRNPAGQSDGGRWTSGAGDDASVAARVGIIQEGIPSGPESVLKAQAMRIAAALPNANVTLSDSMVPKYASIVADSAEEFASKYPAAAATVGYVASVDMKPDTIAQVRSSTDALTGEGVPYPLEKGQVGLELSRATFSQFAGMSLEDVAHYSYQVGFHPVDGVKALIDHEFGHVLDYAAYGTTRHERIMNSDDQRSISGYAKQKGSSEAFAEAFAMSEAGMTLRPDAAKELDAANTQLLENRNTIRAAGVYNPGGEVTCAGYVPEALLPRLTAAGPPDEQRDDHGRWAAWESAHDGATYYHGTNTELKPGDTLEPPTITGKPVHDGDYSRGDVVYLTKEAHLAERYAVGRAGREGGTPHVYEVRPIGGVQPDAEYLATGFGLDQAEAKLAEVQKEIDLPGDVHWENGVMMRGPAVTSAGPPDEARDDHGRWTTGGESVSEHVKAEGGMTYDPATGTEPVDGYIVAKAGIPSTSIDTNTFLSDEVAAKDALKAFLVEHAAEFDDPDAMIGIWHDTDPDHDEIVLDVVERMDTEEEGVQAGIERNQQAIWDVVGKREIPTGGTGQVASGKVTASGLLEFRDVSEEARVEAGPHAGEWTDGHGGSTTEGMSGNAKLAKLILGKPLVANRERQIVSKKAATASYRLAIKNGAAALDASTDGGVRKEIAEAKRDGMGSGEIAASAAQGWRSITGQTELQVAAVAALDADTSPFYEKNVLPKYEPDMAWGNSDKAILTAEYDRTQAMLDKASISEVTLYRGFAVGGGDGYSGRENAGRAPKGWKDEAEVPVSMNPLSAWSLSKDTARDFAQAGAKQYVLEMTVPASDIVSAGKGGLGALDEAEVIVRNQAGAKAIVHNIDGGAEFSADGPIPIVHIDDDLNGNWLRKER